jgi:hypothetical protein
MVSKSSRKSCGQLAIFRLQLPVFLDVDLARGDGELNAAARMPQLGFGGDRIARG